MPAHRGNSRNDKRIRSLPAAWLFTHLRISTHSRSNRKSMRRGHVHCGIVAQSPGGMPCVLYTRMERTSVIHVGKNLHRGNKSGGTRNNRAHSHFRRTEGI